MEVVRDIRVFLDVSFKFCLVIGQQPFEGSLLDLLIVFFLEELVLEKHHRPENEQFPSLWTHVECCHWSVTGEGNRTTRKNGETWLSDVQSGAIGIHKFETAVLILAR